MTEVLANFDFTDFWEDIDYYAREYTDDPLTQEKIRLVERMLGCPV
jgi:hypothetical protein